MRADFLSPSEETKAVRDHEQVSGPSRAELIEEMVGGIGEGAVPGDLEPSALVGHEVLPQAERVAADLAVANPAVVLPNQLGLSRRSGALPRSVTRRARKELPRPHIG